MIARTFACISLLLGCGGLGMVFSNRFKERVRQLEILQNAINEIEFSIDFLNITLDRTFEKVAKNIDGPLEEMFSYVAYRLRENPASDMKKVWNHAIFKYNQALALSQSDIQILMDFSKSLGQGSREKEKNNLKLTSMRLGIALDEARIDAQKNTKMYRVLGFLAGIFVVIILL